MPENKLGVHISDLTGIESTQCPKCYTIFPNRYKMEIIKYCTHCKDGTKTKDIKIDIHFGEGGAF